MAEIFTREARHAIMAGIGSKDTKPELLVRKALHSKGYRFRLHDKRLPGKPDIVLKKWGAIIQVHGCFWHKHNCEGFRWPQTNEAYWREKITRNVQRDRDSILKLNELGWRVLVVWECALKGKEGKSFQLVVEAIERFLRSDMVQAEIPN